MSNYTEKRNAILAKAKEETKFSDFEDPKELIGKSVYLSSSGGSGIRKIVTVYRKHFTVDGEPSKKFSLESGVWARSKKFSRDRANWGTYANCTLLTEQGAFELSALITLNNKHRERILKLYEFFSDARANMVETDPVVIAEMYSHIADIPKYKLK